MNNKKLKINLIYNPTSGQIWSQFKPELVKSYFESKNYEITISKTQAKGDGTKLALQSVKENYDIVIASGGDGTINEVVQGLAGSNTILGILPFGTTNVLAREFNIPLNFQEALEIINSGKVIEMDLGVINDRYFLLMVGIGFDSKLVNEVDSNLKKLTGMVAFAATSPVSMISHKQAKMSITLWDEFGKKKKLNRTTYQILVSNAATYATSIKVAVDAKIDDGLLDLDIFKTNKLIDFSWQLISMAWTRFKHDKNSTESFKVSKINIKAFPPTPVQVDGDSFGHTPVSIEVKKKFLKIIVPHLK